jgi:glycosyltransferase involved in cell wall biosynthesis
MAKDVQLENVEFLGVQPREALPEMLAAMDLHILHQRKEVIDMVVPSKLLTYAASGRPILFAGVPESEGAKFVVNAGAGTVIAPEDPALLAESIATLESKPGERERYARNGRGYVEVNFNRDRILARAEALLLDVAGRRNRFARLPGWEHR